MIYSKYRLRHIFNIFVGIALILSGDSCNKANNASLKSADNSETPATLQQKVLLVVVDGAMGTEMKAVAPPVLTRLTSHAIYSWNGLTNYTYDSITNPSTWTTLLTGVNNAKHGVSNSLSTANLANFPTIFTRLKMANSSLRTVGMVSVDSFKNALLGSATMANSFGGDDAATHTAALAEIKNNNPDLLLVEYHGVDAAGLANTYSANSAAYKSALLQVDTYIGQLVSTIQNRGNYENENWLVIVTSNKGSNTKLPNISSWSAFDDPSHNTFSFYYNPRFVPKITSKPIGIIPYSGQTESYTISGGSSNNYTYVPASSIGSVMNFGPGTEFTMQCKVKFPSGLYSYPSFVGRMVQFDNASPGFIFFLQGGTWGFTATASNVSGRPQCFGGNATDGQWHTLTGVVRIESGQRKMIAFTDGVRGGSVNVNMTNDYTSPADFVVGWRNGSNGGSNINGSLITDVRVYKIALSDAYISGNYCSSAIDTAKDTAYKKLVAFWPSTDISTDGSKFWFKDLGPNHFNLTLKANNPISFSDQSNNVCPPISIATYKSVPNNVDAFPLIFSWFSLPISAAWQLDGQTWVPSYNDVIN